MKYTIDAEHRPPPHAFYGDSYERGLDPWHRDAAPPQFADAFPNQGDRASGWFLLDAWGNEIGFVPDGVQISLTPQQVRGLPKDLCDRLMSDGASVMEGSYTSDQETQP